MKGGRTTLTAVSGTLLTFAPQWSPPMKGGRTRRARDSPVLRDGPQWSPPMKGGRTGRRDVGPAHCIRAAMEPAYERRENSAKSSRGLSARMCRNGARL